MVGCYNKRIGNWNPSDCPLSVRLCPSELSLTKEFIGIHSPYFKHCEHIIRQVQIYNWWNPHSGWYCLGISLNIYIHIGSWRGGKKQISPIIEMVKWGEFTSRMERVLWKTKILEECFPITSRGEEGEEIRVEVRETKRVTKVEGTTQIIRIT